MLFCLLLITILVFPINGDDFSFCQRGCITKFNSESQKDACSKGCNYRKTNANGMFFFIGCHRECDLLFGNATTDEGAACHYACSLPRINSFFMSINFNGKGEPQIQVRQQDGPQNWIEPKFFGGNGALNSFDPKSSSSDEDFENTEERLLRIMSGMRERFLNTIRQQDDSDELEDPFFDDDKLWLHNRMMNQGPQNRFETQPQEHFPLRFQILFLAMSLLALLCVGFIMIRVLITKSSHLRNRNHCLVGQSSAPRHHQIIQLKDDQKVPFDPKPPVSGNAPPAYDELSIASIHEKMAKKTEE